MWPDRVSNPGPLTYESGALQLRYAARLGLFDDNLVIFSLFGIKNILWRSISIFLIQLF